MSLSLHNYKRKFKKKNLSGATYIYIYIYIYIYTPTNHEWFVLFPMAWVRNEITATSYHIAIFLDVREKQSLYTHRFRFENAWVKELACREVVENSWGKFSVSSVIEQLAACSEELHEWGKEQRLPHKTKIHTCLQKLKTLHASIDPHSARQFRDVKNELNFLLSQQQIYWNREPNKIG